MKLAASIFSSIVEPEKKTADLSKFSHLIVAGDIVESTDGSLFRVASKVVGPDGFKFKLANLAGKPVQTPAGFHPISPALAHFAGWMRFVLAYGANFDLGIKAIIEQAFGTEAVDKDIDWTSWLRNKYRSVAKNPDDVDDAVQEVIFNFIRRRDIAKFPEAIKKFPPVVQKLPLDKQITTYLQRLFGEYRKSEAYEYSKKKIQRPEEMSTEQESESGEYNILDTEEHATGTEAFTQIEAEVDIAAFRTGFGDWLKTKMREKTANQYLALFDAYWESVSNYAHEGKIKPRELFNVWQKQTGLDHDSMKVYFANIPGLIEEYIEVYGEELGEVHPYVEIIKNIKKNKKEVEQSKAMGASASLKIAAAEEVDLPEGSTVVTDNTDIAKDAASKICPDCGQPLDLDHAGCKGVEHDDKHGGWKIKQATEPLQQLREETMPDTGRIPHSNVTPTQGEKSFEERQRDAMKQQQAVKKTFTGAEEPKPAPKPEPEKTFEQRHKEQLEQQRDIRKTFKGSTKEAVSVPSPGAPGGRMEVPGTAPATSINPPKDNRLKSVVNSPEPEPAVPSEIAEQLEEKAAAGPAPAPMPTGEVEAPSPSASAGRGQGVMPVQQQPSEPEHKPMRHTLYPELPDKRLHIQGNAKKADEDEFVRGPEAYNVHLPKQDRPPLDIGEEKDVVRGPEKFIMDVPERVEKQTQVTSAKILLDHKWVGQGNVWTNPGIPGKISLNGDDWTYYPQAGGAADHGPINRLTDFLYTLQRQHQVTAGAETEEVPAVANPDYPYTQGQQPDPNYPYIPQGRYPGGRDPGREEASVEASWSNHKKIAGQWDDHSDDSDQVHDILDEFREAVPTGGNRVGFGTPIPPEKLPELLARLGKKGPNYNDQGIYLGVVYFLATHGSQVPSEQLKEAATVAKQFLEDPNYLHEWKDPKGRKKALEEELAILQNAASAPQEESRKRTEVLDEERGARNEEQANRRASSDDEEEKPSGSGIGEAISGVAEVLPELLASKTSAKKDLVVLKKLQEAFPGEGDVGFSPKRGEYIIKWGYFYRHGMSEEKLAEKVLRVIPEAIITKKEDYWHAWPKDSWIEVRFKLPEASLEERAKRIGLPSAVPGAAGTDAEGNIIPAQAKTGLPSAIKGSTESKVEVKSMTSAKEIRAALREKIAARRKERYARLRQVAAEEPEQAEAGLDEMANAFGALADSVTALRENLDLVTPIASANVQAKVLARKHYAKAFRQIAEENPQELEGAINQVYQSLDEVAEALENYADHMGLEIQEPTQEPEQIPMKEAPAEEPVEEAPEEEHEAAGSGSDWFVTDRGDEGKPKPPERAEVPRA